MGGGRDAGLERDLAPREALAAQDRDLIAGGKRGLAWQDMRSGRAVAQPARTEFAVPLHPFVHGLPGGIELTRRPGLSSSTINNGPDHLFSTFGRQAGIIMTVHSVLPELRWRLQPTASPGGAG